MMLVSCSGDVFIRPGQLRVVLANIMIVRDKPQKANPMKKVEDMGVLVQFWVLFFWKLITVLAPGE